MALNGTDLGIRLDAALLSRLASATVARVNCDFIDEQLRFLIGMHIVNGGRNADDDLIGKRYRDMMPRIVQEFSCSRKVDRIIEQIIGDSIEQIFVPCAEQAHCDF